MLYEDINLTFQEKRSLFLFHFKKKRKKISKSIGIFSLSISVFNLLINLGIVMLQ